MSKEIILAASISGKYAIIESGKTIKTDLLAEAGKVKTVAADSREFAVESASQIKAHIKAVEESRTAVKKPFLDAGREIDRLAAEHVKELDAALTRINGAVSEFDRTERIRLAQEAAHAERLRQEAIREANRKREAAEKAAKEAQDALDKPRLDAEARKRALAQQLEAEEAAEEAETAVVVAQAPVVVATPAVVSIGAGGRTTRVIAIVVTDAKALYEKFPHCVKLVPQEAMIKDLIKAGVTVPGVTFTDTQSFSASAK